MHNEKTATELMTAHLASDLRLVRSDLKSKLEWVAQRVARNLADLERGATALDTGWIQPAVDVVAMAEKLNVLSGLAREIEIVTSAESGKSVR